MSIIKFVCTEEQKQNIIKGVWEIIKEHYFRAATPNNTIRYEYEGEDVYLGRLDELMQADLCAIADTDDGFFYFRFNRRCRHGYCRRSVWDKHGVL